MVSLFVVQNGKKRGERQLSAIFLLLEWQRLVGSKACCCSSWRSLTGFLKEGDCRWCLLWLSSMWITVQCFTPLPSPVPRGWVAENRNANFVPSGDFPAVAFWMLWTKATESWHSLHSPVKIRHEYCIMKVHIAHNLLHGSQIRYWALTCEPTDL